MLNNHKEDVKEDPKVLFKETTFVSLQKLQTHYRKGLHQELNMQI